jgi:hypothetical protein
MGIQVPDTLAACLDKDVLSALTQALSPPKAERARAELEVEIESADEGTFTLLYTNGELEGEKGFAEDEPFLSAELPPGGWRLLQKELQAACDGFPRAPELQSRLKIIMGLKRAELEATLEALSSLEDALIVFHVSKVGTFRLARGPLDEATRELAIHVDGDWIESLLGGAPFHTFKDIKVKGDRRLSGDLVSAFGDVWLKLKRVQAAA